MTDGEVVIGVGLDTKSFEKQIQTLQEDLERYTKVLESDAKVPLSLRMSAEEKRNLEVTIEKIRNQLIDLKRRAQDVGDAGESAGERSGKSFEKGIKSLKRFALSLFGIRSAFSLISRASRTYLSQNESVANKMEALWTALGNLVGPIVEIIADAILKLVGYLQVFVNALGWKIDLTKNMNKNTKAINGTTKAMEKLNKQTASFDELNVLSDNSNASGGIGSGGGGIEAFEMPELNKDIVNFLETMAHFLKDNWDWIWKVGVALTTVFGLAKIGKVLGNLGKLFGGGTGAGATGLLGLTGILKGLLAMELITITVAIIYHTQQMEKLKKDNKSLVEWNKQITKESKKVNDQNLETARSYEKGSEAIDKYVYELKSQINSSKDSINAKKKENNEMGITGHILESLTGTRKKNKEIIEQQTQRIIDNATNLQKLAQEGKLTDEQMKVYTETMKYLNEKQKELDETTKSGIEGINLFGDTTESTTKQLYNQIQGLKDNEKQFNTTANNEKTKVSDLAKTIATKFSDINKLIAKPKVEVQTDTNKLKKLSDILEGSGIFSKGIFKGIVDKLRAFGLKTGGIINLPNKGVPLSGAFGGESGREGVIPLTDSQAMETLGEAIGKYINLSATIPVYVGNRMIAREIKKIEADSDFSYNR